MDLGRVLIHAHMTFSITIAQYNLSLMKQKAYIIYDLPFRMYLSYSITLVQADLSRMRLS